MHLHEERIISSTAYNSATETSLSIEKKVIAGKNELFYLHANGLLRVPHTGFLNKSGRAYMLIHSVTILNMR